MRSRPHAEWFDRTVRAYLRLNQLTVTEAGGPTKQGLANPQNRLLAVVLAATVESHSAAAAGACRDLANSRGRTLATERCPHCHPVRFLEAASVGRPHDFSLRGTAGTISETKKLGAVTVSARGSISVRSAGAEDRRRWNALVEAAEVPPLGFHEWQQILHDSYGVDSHLFIAEDQAGAIRGVLPVYLGPGRGATVCYGLRFGLVSDGPAATAALLHAAEALCSHHDVSRLTLCAGYQGVELPLGWHADRRTTVMLDLGPGEDAVWRTLRDKTRNAVRKGGKAGLEIDWSTKRLEEFYPVYLGLMASRNRPAHSLTFFRNIFRQLPDHARLLTAHAEGRLIGGTVVLCTTAIHMSAFQAAAPNGNAHYNVTAFMEWEIARRAIADGVRRLDMGESTTGSGTYKFKTNFGGSPCEVQYLSYPARGSGKAAPGAKKKLVALLENSPKWLKVRLALWRGQRGRII